MKEGQRVPTEHNSNGRPRYIHIYMSDLIACRNDINHTRLTYPRPFGSRYLPPFSPLPTPEGPRSYVPRGTRALSEGCRLSARARRARARERVRVSVFVRSGRIPDTIAMWNSHKKYSGIN